MEWSTLFSAANLVAMAAWAGLILLPRWPALLSALLYIGVGLLCALYTFCMVGVLTGYLDAGDARLDFTSIEGVRAIFVSDLGVLIGWVHYLAFDLFVGLWVARDADAKGISRFIQAPVLLATFMIGPVGLFLWLVIREPAARRLGRPS